MDIVGIAERGGIGDQYRYLEFIEAGEVLGNVMRAERAGYDGFLIGNIADPGLREARELTSMPVAGLGGKGQGTTTRSLGRLRLSLDHRSLRPGGRRLPSDDSSTYLSRSGFVRTRGHLTALAEVEHGVPANLENAIAGGLGDVRDDCRSHISRARPGFDDPVANASVWLSGNVVGLSRQSRLSAWVFQAGAVAHHFVPVSWAGQPSLDP